MQTVPHVFPSKRVRKFWSGDRRQHSLSSLDQILQREGPDGRLFLRCPHCGHECANKTVLGSHIAKVHAQSTRQVFDRLKHSTGGRPRCSGCKELFSSWDRLRKHIEHGACQFPVSETGPAQIPVNADKTGDTGAAREATAPLPTALHPEVHTIVQQGSWRALVQNKQWRKQLAQWCCLCGTWCASNRAVEMHLAKSHREIWNQHKRRIELICKTQQADITVPCSLCGSVSKDPRSHVVACPVIFQSILVDFLRNGGSGGSELFPASATSGQPIPAKQPDAGSDKSGGDKQKSPDRREHAIFEFCCPC